ncbi:MULTISPECIES: helix-turn-helix domain-containing protein [unclassified Enterococcus]|uniref:helix-turn-helix transcriptional regulator n=1 Tax=unclassified Enterococcus TaxID=2608891 RepID=UPI0015531721|nr:MULTISPECIES: helix-turn-helix domain-containing protein [unclassified Enterococcus]MBS7576725.1 helix-turn-helix domain-containing protein [Enterococcus sp. MMGLQ5-2]MBS7583788.1 helix-turn-helix domain-containing protein [Enterococcus sp. MMGLQ5-1]NPD11649.1 helix-turn-helix domain-containing protein [Enterococcus sp. MMGLQ5-1]NPD36562.1 helix-turn-helix domain-containing protein [Enterococcus sp. MMGLQ5-2]
MVSQLEKGQMLETFLSLSQLTKKELAEKLAIDEPEIQKLLAGEVEISPELALKLEKIFDVPAGLWNKFVERYLS